MELLLSVGIRSVERIIEGEIEVAGYLLLVLLALLPLTFGVELFVYACNAFVCQL